ncbi:NEM1 [Candida jiufengensis]|uniref:NEM1 n=1 Tax=Candida jiufengensis TaxID=497108 RepID=UPI002224E4C0|nr:NEM1 [Candida jiufengensis]KAI5955104.1 NEM1 [Candida jiufengensis]
MNSIRLIVNSFDNILPGKSDFELTSTDDQLQDDEQQPEKIEESLQPQSQSNQDSLIDNIDEDTQKIVENNTIKGPCKLPKSTEINVDEELEELDGENKDEVNLTDQDEVDDTQTSQTTTSQSTILSFFLTIWKIIYFFPNYLIIKPIIIIINIIIFPFTLLKNSLGFGTKSNIQNPIYDEKIGEFDSSDVEDDPLVTREKPSKETKQQNQKQSTPESPKSNDQYNDYEDEKILQIKQDNIIANEIKSPTSFTKYMIPPPQRLYPLSRNPQKKRKKKILILDLDETLIHSLSRGSPRSFNPATQSKMIEIRLNNISSLYYVHKRPYCDYFLSEIFKWFELQIFTASVKEYADPIINWLEEEILDQLKKQKYDISQSPKELTSSNYSKPTIFTKRYYRSDCSYRPGVGYIKDLSKYIKDDELKNVMILDNSPISYALHEENAVSIEGWINDSNDRDLLNLLPLLYSLSLCIDVRYILGLKNGEKLFE